MSKGMIEACRRAACSAKKSLVAGSTPTVLRMGNDEDWYQARSERKRHGYHDPNSLVIDASSKSLPMTATQRSLIGRCDRWGVDCTVLNEDEAKNVQTNNWNLTHQAEPEGNVFLRSETSY